MVLSVIAFVDCRTLDLELCLHSSVVLRHPSANPKLAGKEGQEEVISQAASGSRSVVWTLSPCLAASSSRILQTLRFVLLVTSILIQSPWGCAQTTPSQNLRVGYQFWGFQEGAPGSVSAVAQTTDGFLWVGGASGLFRFDGSRFEPFRSLFGDQLLSTINVFALFAPPSGGLWVGYTFGGFSFLNNGRVKNYDAATGSVWGFAQARDGIVWAATTSGLWRFEHSRWQRLGDEWNAAIRAARHLGFDRDGILWVIAGNTLLYHLPGSRHFEIAEKDLEAVGPTSAGFTLDVDRFVVTDPASSPPGNPSSDNEGSRPRAYPVLKAHSDQIIDRNNGVWLRFESSEHLHRFEPQGPLYDALKKVDAKNSESLDAEYYEGDSAALVDQEGNIWFGGPNGLHRFYYTPLIKQKIPDPSALFALAADGHDGAWVGSETALYHVSHGKTAGTSKLFVFTNFIYRAPDSTIWLADFASGLWHETLSHRRPSPDPRSKNKKWFHVRNDLWRLTGRDWAKIDLPPEVADQASFLQAITQDRFGGLWVSLSGRGLYRLANGVWTPHGARDDPPKAGMLCEFTDSLGRVWFGYSKNQLAVLENDRVQVFGPGDGLRVGNITAIYGRGSEIWIGGEFGLQRFDHGRFHNVMAVNDELLRGISGIIETADGELWLNDLSGIFHIPGAEISQALKDPSYQVKGQLFGRREGLPGLTAQLRPLPTAIEGSDGRLWFSVYNGVLWLDPVRAQSQARVPPITIQSVSADDKNYDPAVPLKLPSGTGSVQINYAAVNLSDPDAIHFRYKLQELDRGWHQAATASAVTYRNLPPGRYHFTVDVSDTNGVWSDKVAGVDFTISPAFYQTRAFTLAAVATVLGVFYLLFLLRLKQVTRQVRVRMNERFSERERIARDLHDTLLQSVQGLILKIHVAATQIRREEPARETLEKTLDHADQVLAEGRDRIRSLRGASESLSDLPEVFRHVAQEVSQEQVAEVKVVVEGSPRGLHPMVLEESFSIGREALINALRHSGGLHVEVEIAYHPKQFCLRVRDDGRGIDPEVLQQGGRPDHWGLQGMRERAQTMGAQLRLRSRPEGGTEVELMVPGTTAYRSVSS
jgi:signal transduction histidine kinase/ligand-binding sensor domain-containing protein